MAHMQMPHALWSSFVACALYRGESPVSSGASLSGMFVELGGVPDDLGLAHGRVRARESTLMAEGRPGRVTAGTGAVLVLVLRVGEKCRVLVLAYRKRKGEGHLQLPPASSRRLASPEWRSTHRV